MDRAASAPTVVRRQKNLLEAFRASAREESVAPTNERAATGGPFVDAGPSAGAPRAGLSPALRLRILVGLGLLALVWIAWELGRASGHPTQAAGPGKALEGSASGEPGPSGRAAPAPTSAPPVAPGAPSAQRAPQGDASTPAAASTQPTDAAARAKRLWGEREPTRWDVAFADPANRMSLRIIEYKNSEQSQRLAYDCYQYLLRQALPAVWPIQQGGSLILYVGASSDRSELDKLREHVRTLAGPPPLSRKAEFADAYVVNIDDWVLR